MANKTFVMSDESVNSYGYRVLTDGIKLETFMKNPVMLFSHNDDILPIGRWENIRKEDGKLLADAVFDEKDELAMQVKQKVEDGIMKCCSIGFRIEAVSDDMALALPGQKYSTVTGAELLECSICAIGANRNAMVLYDKDGNRMKEGDENFLSINLKPINTNNNMTKEEFEAQLSEKEETIAQLSEERDALKAEKEKLEQENNSLKEAAEKLKEERIDGKLAEAEKDGRISAKDKEVWKTLMEANEENATKALAGLSKRESLSEMMKKHAEEGAYKGKNWDELDKAGMLSEFKEKDPEGFKEAYKERFKTEYNG